MSGVPVVLQACDRHVGLSSGLLMSLVNHPVFDRFSSYIQILVPPTWGVSVDISHNQTVTVRVSVEVFHNSQ